MAREFPREEFKEMVQAVLKELHTYPRHGGDQGAGAKHEKLKPLQQYHPYSEEQAAAYLGRHPRTLRRWRDRKLHAFYRTYGSQTRYLGEDIVKLYLLGTTLDGQGVEAA